MALDDLARLVCPRKPGVALKVLNCFYMTNGGVTKAELLRQLGLKPRTLEYYLTRFKHWRIISTRRRYCRPASYHLEPRQFHVRADTLLVDPLSHLKNFGLWQGVRTEAAA